MKYKNWNRGTDAEIKAKKHLEKIYQYVEHTKYGEHYDYLVRFGLTDIKIEVKYLELKNYYTYLIIRWGQFMNLINGGEFMIYLMTNDGNGFLKPDDLIKTGHIHFNQHNPDLKHFQWFVGTENGKFIFKYPSDCDSDLCLGSIKTWLDNMGSAKEKQKKKGE